MREEKSYCRLCLGFCGLDVGIDDEERVVSVRGDHDNPATQGYACIKGLEIPSALYSENRIMRPLKRVGDTHVPIPLEQALDEIAERMRGIIDTTGAQTLGFFRGTGTFGSNTAIFSFPGLADSVGGQRFSTMTIDQSAKWVAIDRLGTWDAGRHAFEDAEVWLFAGSNPLVSVYSWHTPVQNPAKRLKEARARGTKIIVIDPRECEMAKFADIHLQIYPGEDAAVAAGLLHIILENGWHDVKFCAQHVQGLDTLRAALAPFTPEVVAARAGIDAADLLAAAQLFARDARRGSVNTGTGVNMAAFPNLAEHLYECLGIVCGRFNREGEALPNPGVFNGGPAPRAQVSGPLRSFEKAPRSRVRGAVRLMGESATPTLVEEILEPGEGQLRGLLISGANPVGAMPDTGRVVEAFRALELLVVIEPFHTATTALADYVLPPKILFEHADMTFGLEMTNLSIPYAQYTPALVPPPADSELCDEGYVAWALAKRLGVALNFMGVEMDMDTPPVDDNDFLAIMARNAAIPFSELQQQALGGRIFDLPPKHVAPANEQAGRFDVMPADVAEELAGFAASASVSSLLEGGAEFDLRLISRRMREISNTSCREFPTARKRRPFNPLCLHPEDMARRQLADGDEVVLVSDNGRIPAIVEADATLKPGVASMTHGFGVMPGEPADYRVQGASVSPLISLDRDCEALQAMPRMSGIPVRIESAGAN